MTWLRRGGVAATVAAAVSTLCGCSSAPRDSAGAAAAWSLLAAAKGAVSPSAQAVMVGDDELLLLGGTGGTPDDHGVGGGVSIGLRTGAVRSLAAPPFEQSLGLSVAALTADTVVVIGSPCVSDRVLSTGDCELGARVAATYSVGQDRWTGIAAPPVSDETPLDAAGAVGASAVFTVRGTGEAIGWDTASSRWAGIAAPLAPSGVTSCASDVGPVAVTSSYVVGGATVSAVPTPTVVDGAEVSGPEPASTSPVVHVLTATGWNVRAQVAVTSRFEFELACGGDTAFLLSQNPTPTDGPAALTLGRIDIASGAFTAVPADPRFRYGAWLEHAVSNGALLALAGSDVEQAMVYDGRQQRWATVPPAPAAVTSGFRVIAATASAVVVRGTRDDGAGRIAVLRVGEL